MKVSAFTYVRNGLTLDYPFLEAIQSILPIVDEFIVVIGDSTDDSRDVVEALYTSKIKIVDTVWDDAMRSGGRIFAEQANIGLDHVSKDADWVFHIQADEVIHEKDLPAIKASMEKYLHDKKVEGLLFNFLNFFGDYKHYAPSRRFHQKEIRVIRNNPHYRSYRDSQGFRWFDKPENMWDETGRKLWVKPVDATVFHYSYVKDPKVQLKKHIAFGNRWQQDDEWVQEFMEKHKEGYDYGEIDFLRTYKGSHPAVMQPRIDKQDWVFKYDPAKNNMTTKEKMMRLLQVVTGKQFFIYKNYKVR